MDDGTRRGPATRREGAGDTAGRLGEGGRPRHYPVSLRVEGRRVLVVGGGPVAARTVASLAECGAAVTVVASDVVPEIEGLERRGSIVVERRPYRPPEAVGYRLVVTATGAPEVDRRVAADADGAGVWVSVAGDAGSGTFVLPAVHRDGPVTIAVSSGGSSPALAAWLRSLAATAAGPHLAELAGLLEEARHRVRSEGRGTGTLDWGALLDGGLHDAVRAGRLEEARRLVDDALDGTRDRRSGPTDDEGVQ